jgi:hypothetical protein
MRKRKQSNTYIKKKAQPKKNMGTTLSTFIAQFYWQTYTALKNKNPQQNAALQNNENQNQDLHPPEDLENNAQQQAEADGNQAQAGPAAAQALHCTVAK